MPLMTWSDNYAIGYEELDLQHQELFDILNRLYDNSCLPGNALDVYDILDELVTYADFHFKSEQEYMRHIAYQDFDNQVKEHVYFTNKVLQLMQDRDMSTSELTKETIVFLCKWLMHHVTVEDKKIVAS